MRRIAIDEITDIKVGINATNVLKRHNLPKELDSMCMSVISGSRTLDLKANDIQTRNKWVQYFYDRVLKDRLEADRPSLNAYTNTAGSNNPFTGGHDSEVLRKHKVSNRYSAFQKACNDDEHQLEEIWVYNIMTNIDAHWDYVKNQPKMMSLNQEAKKNSGGSKTSRTDRKKRFSILACLGCGRRTS